jgi:hypothetical protein
MSLACHLAPCAVYGDAPSVAACGLWILAEVPLVAASAQINLGLRQQRLARGQSSLDLTPSAPFIYPSMFVFLCSLDTPWPVRLGVLSVALCVAVPRARVPDRHSTHELQPTLLRLFQTALSSAPASAVSTLPCCSQLTAPCLVQPPLRL